MCVFSFWFGVWENIDVLRVKGWRSLEFSVEENTGGIYGVRGYGAYIVVCLGEQA